MERQLERALALADISNEPAVSLPAASLGEHTHRRSLLDEVSGLHCGLVASDSATTSFIEYCPRKTMWVRFATSWLGGVRSRNGKRIDSYLRVVLPTGLGFVRNRACEYVQTPLLQARTNSSRSFPANHPRDGH